MTLLKVPETEIFLDNVCIWTTLRWMSMYKILAVFRCMDVPLDVTLRKGTA